MTEAVSTQMFINAQLNEGRTIHLVTALKTISVSPRTAASFKKKGLALFKIDAEGNLRIASGKNYNIIATPSNCLVNIKVIV